MLKPAFDAIPSKLQTRHQWVNWLLEERNGKVTKPPYQPHGKLAETNNPETWSSFSDVWAAVDKFNGVGFVLTKDDPFVALDCDKCRCPAFDGVDPIAKTLDMVQPEIAEHLRRLNAYQRHKGEIMRLKLSNEIWLLQSDSPIAHVNYHPNNRGHLQNTSRGRKTDPSDPQPDLNMAGGNHVAVYIFLQEQVRDEHHLLGNDYRRFRGRRLRAPAPHLRDSIQVSMAVTSLRVLPGRRQSYGTQNPKIRIRVNCESGGKMGKKENQILTTRCCVPETSTNHKLLCSREIMNDGRRGG